MAVLVAVGCSGCAEPLDTRRIAARQGVGDAVYEALCNRLAFAADPADVDGDGSRAVCKHGAAPAAGADAALRALHHSRARLVAAIDGALPPPLAADMPAFLRATLPLYDDGRVGAQARATAQWLQRLEGEPGATAVLARLSSGRDDVAAERAWALSRAALGPTDEPALLDDFFAVLGRRGGGRTHLLRAETLLHGALAEAPWAAAAPPPPRQTAAGLRDLLLRRSAGAPSRPPRWVVARDGRGFPLPAPVAGGLPAPLVDRDGDGLADVDAAGHFVDAGGRPAALGRPFGPPAAPARDPAGRLLGARTNDAGDALVYRYHDSANSYLAGVVEHLADLQARRPTWLLDAAGAVRAALAPEAAAPAPAADVAPVAELAATLGWLAQQSVAPLVLQLGQALWDRNEDLVAQILGLGWKVAAWQRQLTAAPPHLERHSELTDDLIALLAEAAAEPGLLEDVAAALQDPRTAALGPHLAAQMRHVDRIDFDPAAVNALTGQLHTARPADAGDGGAAASVFARLLRLVHDSRQPVCSRANPELGGEAPCDLFAIDDAASFYVRSIVGKAAMTLRLRDDNPFAAATAEALLSDEPDDTGRTGMAALTGIDGFGEAHAVPACGPGVTCVRFAVSPAAASRLMFATHDPRVPEESDFGSRRAVFLQSICDPVVADGEPFASRHAGTLFAWELEGFFDSIRPLLEAFARHDREDLVVRLLDALASHWPTPRSGSTQGRDPSRFDFAAQSGASRFEPLLAQLLDEGDALRLAGRLATAVQRLRLRGHGGTEVVSAGLRQLVLPTWNQAFVPQMARQVGGATAATPAAALRDALGRMGARLPPAPAGAGPDAWDDAAGAWLRVQAAAGGRLALTNRATHALGSELLAFAREALAQHAAAGTLGAWSDSFAPTARAFARSPMLHAGLEVLASLEAQPEGRRLVAELLQRLLGEPRGALVDAAAEAVQGDHDGPAWAPLWRACAVALRPEEGLLDRTLHAVEGLVQVDSRAVLPRLTRQLLTPLDDGSVPLSTLWDVWARVGRAQPGLDGPWRTDDFAAALPALRHFLEDPQHGVARLLELVDGRGG